MICLRKQKKRLQGLEIYQQLHLLLQWHRIIAHGRKRLAYTVFWGPNSKCVVLGAQTFLLRKAKTSDRTRNVTTFITYVLRSADHVPRFCTAIGLTATRSAWLAFQDQHKSHVYNYKSRSRAVFPVIRNRTALRLFMDRARNGRYKANDDFLTFLQDSKSQMRITYQYRTWHRLDGGTLVQ